MLTPPARPLVPVGPRCLKSYQSGTATSISELPHELPHKKCDPKRGHTPKGVKSALDSYGGFVLCIELCLGPCE